MFAKFHFSFLSLFLSACGALHTARPLEKGEQKLGLTFGGVVLTQLGPPIPTPNVILEGQTGLSPIFNRNWEINYGLNLSALAFGTIGTHLGTSYLIAPQNGNRPSLSVMERVHFYNNWLDQSKDSSVRVGYLLNQLDLTAAWDINRHLGYIGISDYIDTADPELILAPFAGFSWQSKSQYFLQMEARYLAINRKPDIVDVSFLGAEYGALSTTISIGWNLQKRGKQ